MQKHKPVVDANRIGRNDPCPCGSGKKAKRCCLPKIKTLAMLPPQYRERFVAESIIGQSVE